MLKQSFVHVPGIGYKTEQEIWDLNIRTWDQFLKSKKTDNIRRVDYIKEYIKESKRALKLKNIQFFLQSFPKAEYWRLYPEFKEQTVFLDIETTGLSPYYNDITIVSTFNGKGWQFYMNKMNLKDIAKDIKNYSILVTYNGKQFDVPFLQSKIPKLTIPPAHIDLRWVLRSLGYEGGLKDIEKQVSINRGKNISNIDGLDATILWNRFLRKDSKSLDKLIKYNVRDVVSLKHLLEIAYNELVKQYINTRLTKKIHKIHCAKSHVTRHGSKVKIHFTPKQKFEVSFDRLNSHRMKISALLSDLKQPYPKMVGVDLKGSEKRSSGYALLEGRYAKTRLVKTDKEIINLILEQKPKIVSIDSPLGLPIGRDCMGEVCSCRKYGITRECERILFARRVPVFPCLLPSMKSLTRRGMKMATRLRKMGIKVIESYPGAAQDILHITRKKVDVGELKDGLIYFGLRGSFIEDKVNHDELDAITSALVGYFYLTKRYEGLGNKKEEELIVPKINL